MRRQADQDYLYYKSQPQFTKEHLQSEIAKQEKKLQDILKGQDLPFDVSKNEIVSEYLYNSEDEEAKNGSSLSLNVLDAVNQEKRRINKQYRELEQQLSRLKEKQNNS